MESCISACEAIFLILLRLFIISYTLGIAIDMLSYISCIWFGIVRNRLYDECAYTTLLRPPCPINMHTVGARERPLNARVVLLHECMQIAI